MEKNEEYNEHWKPDRSSVMLGRVIVYCVVVLLAATLVYNLL